MARLKRLELLTHCLEGSCSIQLSYRRTFEMVERVMGIEPTRPAWKAGAPPLSYTRVRNGAVDEARTRDLHLGKVALYQLSYYRISGA